jgi:hypothetical protein
VRLNRGQPTEDLDRLVERARRVEDLQVLAPALVLAARGAVTSGDTGRALALLKEFDEATTDRASMYRSAHAPEVVRLLIGAGEVELARSVVERSGVVTMRDGVFVDTAAALLHAVEGERDPDTWRALEERWRAYGDPLEEALAAREVGRTDGDTDATKRADALLESLGVPV